MNYYEIRQKTDYLRKHYNGLIVLHNPNRIIGIEAISKIAMDLVDEGKTPDFTRVIIPHDEELVNIIYLILKGEYEMWERMKKK